MATDQVTSPIELRIAAADWARLRGHLFPGDHDEHAAVLLCGMATSARSCRLLVREVVLAPDGDAYVPGTRGYRQLTGEFLTHLVRRARDEQLVYLAVHNHGGTDTVGFSATDLDSHERGYPTLLSLTGLPVGALVLADRAAAGDIWLPDGTRRSLARTIVAGGHPGVFTPAPPGCGCTVSEHYDRQSLLFGASGQHVLGQAKVGIIGVGGVGMLLVQALARLGVGHLVVIDPDRVDPTNLPRLPEATRRDAMTWLNRDGMPTRLRVLGQRFACHKVNVARRIAHRANDAVTVTAVVGDVADDKTAKLLTDCDFLFLAADTMLARDVINQIAYQFLIPTMQVGSKVVIHPETGEVKDVYATVRTLAAQPGCLRCNDLINLRRLGEESVGDPGQVRNQRYVDELEVHAPSVITLNALGVGWAANTFMQYMVGLRELPSDFQLLRTAPVAAGSPYITMQEPNVNPDCHVCGFAPHSAFGTGDRQDLPTRL